MSSTNSSGPSAIGIQSAYRNIRDDTAAWEKTFAEYYKKMVDDGMFPGHELGPQALNFIVSGQPVLEAYLSEAPALRVDNQAWFSAEFERPARPHSKTRGFTGPAVRLPKKLTGCDLPESCGKSASFGGGGKELVLLIERIGGDCVERACLLHDPKTGLFATPPKLTHWASAKETKPGSCGPYLFDASQSSFLVDHWLCSVDGGCRDLGGEALGWLVPGGAVGAPGTGNFEE